MNSHVQRVDDEFSAHMRRHRPADNAATEYVEHDGRNRKPASVGTYVMSATQSSSGAMP